MIRAATSFVAGVCLAGLAVVGSQRTAASTNVPLSLATFTGVELFQAKGCAACHRGPDTKPIANIGPPLTDVAAWASSRISAMSARAYLDESIREPTTFRSPLADADTAMPQLNVSDAEIDALVEYLLQG